MQVPAQAFTFTGRSLEDGVALVGQFRREGECMDLGGKLRRHGPQHPLVPPWVTLPRRPAIQFKRARIPPAQGQGCGEHRADGAFPINGGTRPPHRGERTES